MHKWVRRFLALITLVGSVYGLTSSIFSILEINATGEGVVAMILAAVGVVFFLFGILSGFWLLESTPKAIMANSFFWMLQLPAIVSSFFVYKVFAFGRMAFATDTSFSGFHVLADGAPLAAPASHFGLSLGQGAGDINFSLNIFALIMLVLLFFARGGTSRGVAGTIKNAGGLGFGKAATLAGGAAALAGGAVAASAKGAASVASAAGDAAGSVASAAGDVAGGAVDLAGSAVSGVADGVGAVASGALDTAGSVASVAGDVAGGAVDLAGSAVSGVADGVGAVAGGALDAAGSVASVAGGAVDLADSAVSGVADGVGAVAGGALDVAGAGVTGVVGAAGAMGGNALDLAKEAVDVIGGSATAAAEDLIETKDG